MDIKETEWKHTDWNCLAENRDKCCTLGNMVMELWVSQSVGGGISWLANLPKKDCTTKLVGLFHPSFPSASYGWFRTFWMWETQGPCQPLSYQCWYWSPSYIYLGHHCAPKHAASDQASQWDWNLRQQQNIVPSLTYSIVSQRSDFIC